MAEASLVNRFHKFLEDYEGEWQSQYQELQARIKVLEQENQQLRQELETGPSVFDEVRDEGLKERLSKLRTSPLDTIIREAGVILEDRLRTMTGVTDKHGVSLVDAALAPQTGILRYSTHSGEQEGVKMLYRGAMQFVRNPPMHKLIEYPESTARLLIRLIDALLQLLSEADAPFQDKVTVENVRKMLRRRRISEGQLIFYKTIYDAGEKGLSMAELASAIGRNRAELTGILGGLGNRINKTEGLEEKGGILVIVDITEGKDGDWHYKIRPVLRQALEAERLV